MEPIISIEETQENERQIRIAIPHSVFRSRYDQQLRRAMTQANVKGFRPGRAPLDMVSKLYGDSIRDDVVGNLLGDAYRDAVKEHSLKVVGRPDINVDPVEADKDLQAVARVDIFPEPKVKDYFGVEFEVELEQFQNDEVKRELEVIRTRYARVEPITEDRRNISAGDVATIDYTATVEDKPFQGSEGLDAQVEVGAGELPEEFEKALLGMSLEEEKEFTVAFPEDLTNKEIAGKVAKYRVKLKGIHKKILPELTDDFIKENLKIDSLSELEKEIEENFRRQVEQKNKNAKEEKLFVAISSKNSFRVPQVLVDEEIRTIFFESGILNPREEKSYKIDVSPFREQLQSAAEARVRRGILLHQIIQQEKIEISDDDVEAWILKQVEETKQDRQKVEQYFGLPKNTEGLKNLLAKEKMTERLLEKAKVRESVRKEGELAGEDSEKVEGKKEKKKKGRSA